MDVTQIKINIQYIIWCHTTLQLYSTASGPPKVRPKRITELRHQARKKYKYLGSVSQWTENATPKFEDEQE